MNKKAYVIYGYTYAQIDHHLRLCGVSNGRTGRHLLNEIGNQTDHFNICGCDITSHTNTELMDLVDSVIADYSVKLIFFPAAVVDFDVAYSPTRLSSKSCHVITLTPSEKIINKIRAERKDIFLVTFKVIDSWANEATNIKLGMEQLKKTSSNIVVVNDAHCKRSIILTPEEGVYEPLSRDETIQQVVKMALLRSHLTFTRSTVVSGEPVSWADPRIPSNLRSVIDWVINEGGYKKTGGTTPGHFAVKLGPTEFLTSIRRSDFNRISEVGMVRVVTDGPDSVLAYGAKPSVGGQSQRAIFSANPGFDSIVHFHCPMREGSAIPVVSQFEFECGSHECGKNTTNGLKVFSNGIAAVMLDNHGPNIVFNSTKTSSAEVIQFIKDNFHLDRRSNGYTY